MGCIAAKQKIPQPKAVIPEAVPASFPVSQPISKDKPVPWVRPEAPNRIRK